MSVSQQIRDALRALGTANAEDIAARCESDIDTGSVSKQLHSGENHGWVLIDRTERPYRYTLIEERANAVESYVHKSPLQHSVTKPPANRKKRQPPENASRIRTGKAGKAKRTLIERQKRATPAVVAGRDDEWSQRVAQKVPAAAAAPRVIDAAKNLAREIHAQDLIHLPSTLILRLCALALSPDDRSANDLRDIATAIKAAA